MVPTTEYGRTLCSHISCLKETGVSLIGSSLNRTVSIFLMKDMLTLKQTDENGIIKMTLHMVALCSASLHHSTISLQDKQVQKHYGMQLQLPLEKQVPH